MASMTLTASFLGGSAITKPLPTAGAGRRGGASLVVIKASKVGSEEVVMKNNKAEEGGSSSSGRRDLVFAVAAAAAACTVAKAALADGLEPKRGTPEAKKKYAPICVTMPTAKICRK